MATQQDVIKEFMKFLDGTDQSGNTAVDLAIQKASSGKYNSISDVENELSSNLVKTLKKNGTTYTGESIDEFLNKYCGIILGNEDTGAITGKDANGSSVSKNKYDIIPENTVPIDIVQWYIKANIPDVISSEMFLNKSKDSTLKIVPHNGNKDTQVDLKFTKNGLTMIVPNYNQILKKANEGNEEALLKLTYINGLYTWWVEESLKLIKQSFDYEFDSNATVQEITLQFINGDDAIAYTAHSDWWDIFGYWDYKLSGVAKQIILKINLEYVKDLDLLAFPSGKLTNNKDGKDLNEDNEFLLDSNIAHEFTHAAMMARINKYDALPFFIKEGMAELTAGADVNRESAIKEVLVDIANGKELPIAVCKNINNIPNA